VPYQCRYRRVDSLVFRVAAKDFGWPKPCVNLGEKGHDAYSKHHGNANEGWNEKSEQERAEELHDYLGSNPIEN